MVAMLAFIVVGFSFLTFLSLQAGKEANEQRDRILALQSSLAAQQARGDARFVEALQSVSKIVAAERTVTREIVRSEVQARPTTTVTATRTQTVTATETIIISPGPGQGCVRVLGVSVCRGEMGMLSMISGLSGFAFWMIRRGAGI